MGERADLDAVQARYQTAWELVHGPAPTAAIGALIESQADVPALVAELRVARQDGEDLAWTLRDVLDWSKRSHGGDPGLHPEEYYRTTEHAQRVLAAYDQHVQPNEEDGDG